MARVDVPDAVEGRNDILIEPADNDDVEGAIMRSKGYTANVATDSEGVRYVGVHADKAGPLMDRWSEKYGVEYDRETGRIVSEGTPSENDESDAESDRGGVTSQTIREEDGDSDDASGGDSADADDEPAETLSEAEVDPDEIVDEIEANQGDWADEDAPAPNRIDEAHWNTAVTAVENGLYTRSELETIREVDDRSSVQEAVEDALSDE